MQDNNLVFASPESLGIPSQAILDFLDEMVELRFPIHGFVLLRHGKIAAEGYCPPFDANRNHRMYSVSKSFTSLAIGRLVTEGKLSLEEKVADIFPEYLPENPHPYILEATVRHLLMMSTFNESSSYDWNSPDFVKTFFQNDQYKHKPGTVFHYDTAATVTLCGIVEKRTGQSLMDYMRPVFDEIGFSKTATCLLTPEGRCWTGSGVLCTPRDLARIGLLCMNHGAWNGKQLIDADYMKAATSHQIDTTVGEADQGGPMGYGYQFWMLEEGGFSCLGMGSQFCYCMPKYDTVMIMTADTQAFNGAGDAIRFAHYRMLRKMQSQPLPEDPALQAALKEALNLKLPLPVGVKTTPRAAEFSGRTYAFEENRFGFKWMRINITDDVCTLKYENRTGVHEFPIFMGEYKGFIFPEKYYGFRICPEIRQEYQSVSAGAWTWDNSLLATVYAVDDYVGTLKMQFTFDGDDLTVFMSKVAEAFFEDYRSFLAGHEIKS